MDDTDDMEFAILSDAEADSLFTSTDGPREKSRERERSRPEIPGKTPGAGAGKCPEIPG